MNGASTVSNPTETLTLTDFLLARIAEDEAMATRATGLGPVAQYMSGTRPSSRWLAECEAKRRIVAEAGGGGTEDWDVGWDAGLDRTLRLLGTVYADHPDYREEWR